MLMPCVSGTISIVKPAITTHKPEKMKKRPKPSASCRTGTNCEITIPKVQFVVVVIDTPFAPDGSIRVARISYTLTAKLEGIYIDADTGCRT